MAHHGYTNTVEQYVAIETFVPSGQDQAQCIALNINDILEVQTSEQINFSPESYWILVVNTRTRTDGYVPFKSIQKMFSSMHPPEPSRVASGDDSGYVGSPKQVKDDCKYHHLTLSLSQKINIVKLVYQLQTSLCM